MLNFYSWKSHFISLTSPDIFTNLSAVCMCIYVKLLAAVNVYIRWCTTLKDGIRIILDQKSISKIFVLYPSSIPYLAKRTALAINGDLDLPNFLVSPLRVFPFCSVLACWQALAVFLIGQTAVWSYLAPGKGYARVMFPLKKRSLPCSFLIYIYKTTSIDSHDSWRDSCTEPKMPRRQQSTQEQNGQCCYILALIS